MFFDYYMWSFIFDNYLFEKYINCGTITCIFGGDMSKIDEEVRNIYLSKLKSDLERASFPPSYDGDFDFYDSSFGFNCYAYAMQFKTSYEDLQNIHPDMLYPYNLGYISRGIPIFSYDSDNVLRYFLDDCNILGLDVRSSTLYDENLPDEYKIAILINKFRSISTGEKDYHFLRQNDDYTWSEMKGLCGPVGLVSSPLNYRCHDLVEVVKIRKLK